MIFTFPSTSIYLHPHADSPQCLTVWYEADSSTYDGWGDFSQFRQICVFIAFKTLKIYRVFKQFLFQCSN